MSGIPHGRRHEVGNRDAWRCVYCGRRVLCIRCNPRAALGMTVDHVVPKSIGGSSHPTNLATCCQACNLEKADHPWMRPPGWTAVAKRASRNGGRGARLSRGEIRAALNR